MVFQIIPAPSPRGTNRARLYVPAKTFGAGFAYDEALEAPAETSTKSGLDTFIRILRTMSPDARHELIDGLCGNEAEDEECSKYPDDADLQHIRLGLVKPSKAKDAPSKFKGMPRPGGAMDSAAAEKSFAERFPEAMKIGHGGVSVSPKLSTPVSAPTSKRFEEMFPDAAKIKVHR